MSDRFSHPEHEPALTHSERRGRGVFYTPREIAEWITRATYGPLVTAWHGSGTPPRVLDPACGGGVFLSVASEMLRTKCAQLRLSEYAQSAALQQAIFGMDVDPNAVTSARESNASLSPTNVHCADTLVVENRNSFDAIIGNPPYVSIRELARTHSRASIDSLRARYLTARGNFDLYVPFWERSLELLRPGGRLGFIVPNKWATLDYARGLRELLLSQTTIEQIVDVSALRVFPQASAYPQIVILKKRPPAPQHFICVTQLEQASQLLQLSQTSPIGTTRQVVQAKLTASALVLGNDLAVEERVRTLPLGSLCELHSGASGYSAALIAGELREADECKTLKNIMSLDFIVSGNIDRYAIAPGNVRFLKQSWLRPCLSLDSQQITADKARLYREPKIVFSGMSRRLEAAYDEQGCALGVQVFAAREMQLDPFYLLAILNSKLLSYLFRERFAAKRLAGGYLAINKGQLAQLPIALPDHAPAATVKRLARLARQLQLTPSTSVDDKLDEFVYSLYELKPGERERVEQSMDEALKPVPRRSAA